MRYIQFKHGLQTFISGEEREEINEKRMIPKKDLSEREQQVARRLAEKSILTRLNTDDKIYYKIKHDADTIATY
jgi:hypothetical protein